MQFSKEIVNEAGVTLGYHQLSSAALSDDLESLDMVLLSWGTEDASAAGAAAVARTFVRAGVAGLDLSGGLVPAVESAVLASTVFAGATVLPDSRSDFAAAKVRKWAEIKAVRDSRMAGGFGWGGALFDSDARSVARVLSAALSARAAVLSNSPFDRSWTLADNSELSLNATEMQAVAAAMDAHMDAIHSIAVDLRAEIDTAPNIGSLAAIVWPG